MFSAWRWIGLLSIVVIVLAAAVPLLGQPLDHKNSVSRTWTGSHRKWLIMALVMTIAGTGLCASLALWVTPHYKLPWVMYGVILLAYCAFMGVAWVPMHEKPGEHSYLHWHFLGGATLATLAIVAMALVIWFGDGVSTGTRTACTAAMVLAAIWPTLFFTPARHLFLILESLTAFTFSVAVILLLAA